MSRRNLTDRLLFVEELLSSGISPANAAQEAAIRFGVGHRQAQKYVEKALTAWAEEEAEMRGKRRLQVRFVAQNILRQCIEREKWMPAIRVIDLLCKMDGLYEPEPKVVVRDCADRWETELLLAPVVRVLDDEAWSHEDDESPPPEIKSK